MEKMIRILPVKRKKFSVTFTMSFLLVTMEKDLKMIRIVPEKKKEIHRDFFKEFSFYMAKKDLDNFHF